MNNEPVAWVNSLTAMMEESFEVYKTKQVGFDMPLYTHPAKTLTDEEILIEAKYQPNLGYYLACEYDVLDFAKAILRKAQEKC